MTVRPQTAQTDPGWLRKCRQPRTPKRTGGFDGHRYEGSRFGVGSRRPRVAKDTLS
jgi:hypothetical protein